VPTCHRNRLRRYKKQTRKSKLHSGVALYSTYTRALTFENLYKVHGSALVTSGDAQGEHFPLPKTNLYIVALLSEYTRALTFGVFFLAPVLVGACQVGGVDAATQAAACGIFVLGGSVRVIARHAFFNKTKVLYIVALLTHSLERVIASALRYVGADLSPRESADDESSGMGGREGEAGQGGGGERSCRSRGAYGGGSVGGGVVRDTHAEDEVQGSAAREGGRGRGDGGAGEAEAARRRRHGNGAEEGVVRGVGGWGVQVDLPEGWEVRFRPRDRRPYYVDHNTRTTNWHPPPSLSTPVTGPVTAPHIRRAEAGADAMEAAEARGTSSPCEAQEGRGAGEAQGEMGDGGVGEGMGCSENAQVEYVYMYMYMYMCMMYTVHVYMYTCICGVRICRWSIVCVCVCVCVCMCVSLSFCVCVCT
jgi:hypothetical protein